MSRECWVTSGCHFRIRYSIARRKLCVKGVGRPLFRAILLVPGRLSLETVADFPAIAAILADDYERQAKFTTWLYAITRNTCFSALRYDARRRMRPLDETHEPVARSSEIVSVLNASDVWRLVEQLPEAQRLVITLFYLEDRSLRCGHRGRRRCGRLPGRRRRGRFGRLRHGRSGRGQDRHDDGARDGPSVARTHGRS